MRGIKIILLGMFMMIFSACDGQAQKEKSGLSAENNSSLASGDSAKKPRVEVKVNRQYDDKGRLIKFDSTYSYFYSELGGTGKVNNDSVFRDFRSFFENGFPNYLSNSNHSIFFNDTLFKYDFFNDDYFQKRFELNENMFRSMYKQMDSIKLDFLKQNYPNNFQKRKIK